MHRYIIQLLLLCLLLVEHGIAKEMVGQETAYTASLSTEDDADEEFDEEFASESEESVSDPLEGYNRWMSHFNDRLFLYLIDPVAHGYATVVPQPMRIGISNALYNLKFPVYFTNNVLQLKLGGAFRELERFVINSTIGFLGFVDVARKMGIEPSREDFGQTLGHWGVGSGFYLVLPLWGSSNLRDALAMGGDWYLSPLSYTYIHDKDVYHIPKNGYVSTAIKAGEMLNATSLHLDEYQSIKKDTLDWYTFMRDTYEEKRRKEIDE